MVDRKTVVSRALALTVLLGFVVTTCASAQPSEFTDCISSLGPLAACSEVTTGISLIPCPELRAYQGFLGRIAWGPLRYVGPITIEIGALQTSFTRRFPLVVEFVVIPDDTSRVFACDFPGMVLANTFGEPDCKNTVLGPYSLEPFVGVGERYLVRLHALSLRLANYHSPHVDCIRVTADPVLIEPSTWSIVKRLYR